MNPTSDNFINIYPGVFKKNFGSYHLETAIYERILKKVGPQISSRYERKSERIYRYRDMLLILDRNCQQTVTISKQTRAELKPNMMLEMVNEKKMDRDQFPSYDQYHNIADLNSVTYRGGPNQQISVAFITEIYGDEKINYIKVSFANHHDPEVKKYADHIVGVILKEISL